MSVQTILKRINISTAIVLFALTISSLILIFYRPSPSTSVIKESNKALEDLREAQMNLAIAKLDSIRLSQMQLDAYSEKKEKEFKEKLDANINDLKKIRYEKPRDYTDYNSQQLQREVSELVRQYEISKQRNKNVVEDW